MKYHLLPLLMALSFVLVGCDNIGSKKTTSSASNALNCAQYPYSYGCQPTTTGGYSTGGGTTGTSTTGPNCSVAPIDKTCPQYCQIYPGAYGCLPNGTNCNANPSATGCPGSSTTTDPSYGSLYGASGPPSGSCSEPYSSASGAYNTRKATMTVVGGSWYNPATPPYYNTSSMLTSVSSAKTFFMTDSMVKVRFKVKPQPESAGTNDACYGRNKGSSIPGYTKLKFNVLVRGVNSDGSLTTDDYVGQVEAGVNSCTPALDLSSFKAKYPNGIVVLVSSVLSNQKCSSYNWTDGFKNCTTMGPVRTIDCWSLDMEVAADGTKTFD